MAANSLDNLVNTILAKSLKVLRSRVTLARLVSNEGINGRSIVAEQGDTVNIPIYGAKDAAAVTASSTPLAPSGSVPTKVAVSLDQWYETHFYRSDKDMLEIYDRQDDLEKESAQCAEALANNVNEYLFSFLNDVPSTSVPGGVFNAVGTAGTTPFASTINIINEAAALLNNHNAPIQDRVAILNYSAASNFKSLTGMYGVDSSGSDGIVVDGEIGRKFGFNFFEDGQVPFHNSAGAATTATYHASAASNLLVINNGDSSQTFTIGDIVSISGNLQTFMVASASTISSNVSGSITVVPNCTTYITSNIASGAAVTHSADQYINLALHRSAFAFANRPLGRALLGIGGETLAMSEMTDPISGLSMRLEVKRQNKQTLWQYDMLYGGMLVRPELCCRIMG